MNPLTVTIARAAELTGLSQDTIRDAVNRLALPAKRNGRRIVIRYADLEKWVDSMEDVT